MTKTEIERFKPTYAFQLEYRVRGTASIAVVAATLKEAKEKVRRSEDLEWDNWDIWPTSFVKVNTKDPT